MFSHLGKWRARALIVAAGLLLAVGQAPISVPVGVVLGLPVLALLLLRADGVRDAFMLGWLAGAAYFTGHMFWIVEPFLVEPEVDAWLSPIALIAMCAGLALFWGVGFGIAGWFSPPVRLLILTVSLTLSEFVRSHVFTGFPWGLLAYVWSETPVFQLLSWIGPHGLGMITLAVGVLPMLAAQVWQRCGILAVSLFALWGLGAYMLPGGPAPLRDVTVRLVQPNAPQHLKWHPDYKERFFERNLSLSNAGGKELSILGDSPASAPTEVPVREPAPVDVVIWPESSFPFPLGLYPPSMERLQSAVAGTQFIGGIQRPNGRFWHNSLMHLDVNGDVIATYDKHHLVPFGEYVPLAQLAARFGIRGLAAHEEMGFAPGQGVQIISVGGLPPYLPLICYEAIFPDFAQAKGARPEWLLHLTNDAWFGAISGPYQHLVQARARAVEQGLPMARAGNTGISAMIDPYGRLVASLPLNRFGFLDVHLPEPAEATIYSRWGEIIWMLMAALLLAAAVLAQRRTAE